MYLEMIFWKNKEQTMRQLQFKFDPLPTESAGICLFHERWIKAFETQPSWSFVHSICPSILENLFGPILQQIYGRPFTKNTHFGHSENGKCIFCEKKMKTPLGNIVWNSKVHPCSWYEVIWTKYAMDVAISLIIWLESHESSRMIAHFWEYFLKIISVLQVYYFSWNLGHI